MKLFKALIVPNSYGFEPYWKELEAENWTEAYNVMVQFSSLQDTHFLHLQETI